MKTFIGFIGVLVASFTLYLFGPLVFMVVLAIRVYSGGLTTYPKTVLISMSQMLAAIVYGIEDWTFSSLTHFYTTKGYKLAQITEVIVDIIAWPFERNHCKTSYSHELAEIGMNPDQYRKVVNGK